MYIYVYIYIYINICILSGFSSHPLTIHGTVVYYFHPLSNIETFICNFACEMTVTYF